MNSSKIIIDLCGGTGSWSKPYSQAGYTVFVITLPDYDVCETEFYKEFMTFKNRSMFGNDISIFYNKVYGILAAPPCTMFSLARTNAKRKRNLIEGMETVEACLKIIWACQFGYQQKYGYRTSLKFWSLENPNGFLKYFLGRPVFEFHPYEFGDNYTKNTSLWGWFNFPVKTNNIKPKDNVKFDRLSINKLRSITDIHFKYCRNPKERQILRSITPPHFSNAFFNANK